MKKKLIAAIVSTAVALTVSGTTFASADDQMGNKGGKGISNLLSTLVTNGLLLNLKQMQLLKLRQI